MKNKITLLSVLVLTIFLHLSAQASYRNVRYGIEAKVPENGNTPLNRSSLRFDGLYLATSERVKSDRGVMQTYIFLRFYGDGTVLTVKVASDKAENVAKWFGKSGQFEMKGSYLIKGAKLHFVVDSEHDPASLTEGVTTHRYTGRITDRNKLFLMLWYDTKRSEELWFEFVPIDSTKMK